MGAHSETVSGGWRRSGVRVGLVSVLAATGVVLGGGAALATPTVAAAGGSTGLPMELTRLAEGNSGAVCGGGGEGGGSEQDGGAGNVLSGISVLAEGTVNAVGNAVRRLG